jgi:hypothetical protein
MPRNKCIRGALSYGQPLRCDIFLEELLKRVKWIRDSFSSTATSVGLIGHLPTRGPSLSSSSQRSWLQIQGTGFDSRRNQIFWDVLGLERGPLSLVSTIEELLGRKGSSCGVENRDYGRRGSAALTTRQPSIRKKLALTSVISGGRSVCIVRSRTNATEFNA